MFAKEVQSEYKVRNNCEMVRDGDMSRMFTFTFTSSPHFTFLWEVAGRDLRAGSLG